jgi:hypothetical protein
VERVLAEVYLMTAIEEPPRGAVGWTNLLFFRLDDET